MNVIFLDFDGVLNTIHDNTLETLEKRIQILSFICKKYQCKIVIEASAKDTIDEYTLKTTSKWVQTIFNLFKKYNIECIGRTPNVTKKLSNISYLSMWKEDEIRLYLYHHPEIEHYCIIDDNDSTDLNKLKNHLVETKNYSKNKEEEGLLPHHIELVGEVLKLDNEIKKGIERKQKR